MKTDMILQDLKRANDAVIDLMKESKVNAELILFMQWNQSISSLAQSIEMYESADLKKGMNLSPIIH